MAFAVATHKGVNLGVTATNPSRRIYSGHLPVVSLVLTIRISGVTVGHQVEVLVNGGAVPDGVLDSLARTWALTADNGAIKSVDICLRGTGPGNASFDYDLSVYV